MNDRLIQFLSAEDISQAQFADSINVARAGISHIVAGRNKPGWDFIINTMNRYPTLNIEWLLTGKGKMYKSSALNGGNGGKIESNSLFDGMGTYNECKSDGEMFEPDTVELSGSATQTTHQHTPQTVSQPTVQQVNQPVSQPVPQQTALPYPVSLDTPQPAPQIPPQAILKRPNVAKIIVFFDDGTFQECK